MSETIVVSVSCTLSVEGAFCDVKQLEDAIVAETFRAGQQLYQQAAAAYQDGWLAAHAERYVAVRWRERTLVTPLGELRLPVRVVRERDSAQGGYHSLAKLLWRGKATRLLSPAVEQQALEAATEQNYRPAAARVSQWCRAQISHWAVWSCVQYYGAKLQEQMARDWWPEKAHRWEAEAVVTEMDATWLKRQRWGAQKKAPQYFLMQLGLHYTGRAARYEASEGRTVALVQKSWLASTESVGLFGTRLRRQRDRHYGSSPALGVVLSDGDEGLERVREEEFGEAVWLLDRWHVAKRVREFVGADQEAYRRIMAGVYASDSEAVLEALRAQAPPAGSAAERSWRDLFGYVLGNREGIDAYARIAARWRRQRGREGPVVRAGSGAVEKNVEVQINRRFKKQGRSWDPVRADRLMQLRWLQTDRRNWQHWWERTCLSTTKVNPGWAPTDN
jgi:hypothetical protein